MVAKAIKYDSLADSYWKHVDFVAGALAVDLPTAQSYCMAQLALVQAAGTVEYAQVRNAVMALATGAPVNVIATAPDPAIAVLTEQIAQLTGKTEAIAKQQTADKPPAINITNEFRLPDPVAPIVNVAAPEAPAPQPAPVINITNEVNVPEQAAPVVNVEAPVVNVSAPSVSVTNDVQPAPVTVNNAFASKAVQTVERDENDEITRTVTQYE